MPVTARVGVDCGSGIWRSAGFQVGEMILIIGRLSISHKDGTRVSMKWLGPDTVSGMKMV
jgi:hypothetical protein